jgi:hypothetical protein
LGLQADRNLFVTGEGDAAQWRTGEYVPAYLRRYPFIFVDHDDQYYLAIDRDCAAINTDEGRVLFNEDGSQSAYVGEIMTFMRDYQQAVARTQQFLETLSRLDLLEEITATFTIAGETSRLGGLLRVNEAKLDALAETDIQQLIQNGFYKLVTAHLISLTNLQKLLQFAG